MTKEPRGIRNNNPLNIRKGSTWKGEREHQTDPAFEEFVSMEFGIRAAFKLVKNHIEGFGGARKKRDTLAKLISVWAPPSENATNRYIEFVAKRVGLDPNERIDFKNRTQMASILQAMAFVECGVEIPIDKFFSGYDLV